MTNSVMAGSWAAILSMAIQDSFQKVGDGPMRFINLVSNYCYSLYATYSEKRGRRYVFVWTFKTFSARADKRKISCKRNIRTTATDS